MNRKRILIGTYEIANQIFAWGESLRQMGHQVHTVVRDIHEFYRDSVYSDNINTDYNLELTKAFNRDPLSTLLSNGEQLMKIRSLLIDYEIYIFQWGYSLFGRLDDLFLLKQLGKKIICVFNGSDIRASSAYSLYCKKHSLYGMPKYSSRSHDPDGGLNHKLRLIRLAELYADAVFGMPDFCSLNLKPYFHLYYPLDTSKILHAIPARDRPVVVHAPSSREVKGTENILAAVEELKVEGVKFEFVLLEGVDNGTVRNLLADADIAVDQIHSEYPATFALEAMAAGCAVVSGNRPDIVPYPPDTPCVNADPDTIKDRMKQLIIDKSYRIQIAARGREYVCKWHRSEISASRLLSAITRRNNEDYDYYPNLFINEFVQPNYEPLNSESKNLNMSVLKTMKNITQEQWESLKDRGLIPD